MADTQAAPGHPDSAAPAEAALPDAHHKASFWTLALGSVGVVYGDIGTSPLYALREAVSAVSEGGPPTRDGVIGVLSLILWSLTLVVTLKYVVILLRADNNGEGGTLTLVALAQRAMGRRAPVALLLGAAGAGLFYGDAVITPAISVLSAMEGLKIATPAFEPYIVPVALVILVSLFMVQGQGTSRVAAFFGPIMVVWFLVLIGTGLLHIADDPGVFAAVNPVHGIMIFVNYPGVSLAVLGAVALVATGTESLYSDLGHFGRGPVRVAWLGLVFPALIINYFGQGALVLSHPETIENPFFNLVPEWAACRSSAWRRSPPSRPARR
jgi:KUP system potassium uptake protein